MPLKSILIWPIKLFNLVNQKDMYFYKILFFFWLLKLLNGRTRETKRNRVLCSALLKTNLWENIIEIRSDQIRSVAQLCLTLCDPVNRSTAGLPVQHQLPEFTETHVHRVSDAIQSPDPLTSPSPPAPNPSQHQSLFQCSSHEVAKVLEFQL